MDNGVERQNERFPRPIRYHDHRCTCLTR